mmetsp:Transcript_10949/g.13179  ORF Transcript_10949/g.13179 Transcript_10949/m.13179 type:complete len:82 (+) Transcript_10949:139-384(+)
MSSFSSEKNALGSFDSWCSPKYMSPKYKPNPKRAGARTISQNVFSFSFFGDVEKKIRDDDWPSIVTALLLGWELYVAAVAV